MASFVDIGGKVVNRDSIVYARGEPTYSCRVYLDGGGSVVGSRNYGIVRNDLLGRLDMEVDTESDAGDQREDDVEQDSATDSADD